MPSSYDSLDSYNTGKNFEGSYENQSISVVKNPKREPNVSNLAKSFSSIPILRSVSADGMGTISFISNQTSYFRFEFHSSGPLEKNSSKLCSWIHPQSALICLGFQPCSDGLIGGIESGDDPADADKPFVEPCHDDWPHWNDTPLSAGASCARNEQTRLAKYCFF